MKKLFLVLAVACFTLTANAQDESKFIVKAGVGMSTLVGKDTKNTKANFAYKLGVAYDASLSDNFAIRPGLELVNKGYKYKTGITGSINMFYLQVPVLAAYKINIGDNKLVLQAGPYVSYGIFGSEIDWGGGEKTKIFDKDEGGFKRFDAGVMAGVNYEFSQFLVGVEYSRGLAKLSDYKQYHQAFGVVVGYKF
ncbi:MAG: PorT family protein [Prevotella sp.]|nr:PorT family protein [Prevotella sp.]